MAEAYRDVIIRIKAEADSSVEKTLSGIGGKLDHAARTFEQGLVSALNNVNAAIKRLESTAGRLGGGGGFGGDGASLMGGGKPIGGGGMGGAAVGGMPHLPSGTPVLSWQANSTQAATVQNLARFNTPAWQQAAAFRAVANSPGVPAAFQSEYAAAANAAAAMAMAPSPSLAQINGRAGATPYNRMAGFGAYAPGPGPTASGRGGRAGGLPFDRDRLIGLGIGMASGNWDSVASGVGTVGGTLAGMKIGAMYGAAGGPWGAAIGGMVGGAVGTLGAGAAGGVSRGFNPDPSSESLSTFQRYLYGGGAFHTAIGFNQVDAIDRGFAQTGRMRGERSFRQRQMANAEIDRATDQSIAEFRGSAGIQRALLGSDGTLKSDLAATQAALGSAATDEQRLQLRQRELEITRQISREQVQGAQAALAGLEREKQALEDMLSRRKRQTDSAGSAFGYASRGDQEAAVRAAEKYNSGQGATVSRREREAFESLAPQFGTENGMKAYEAEGRRRGGNMLDRFLTAIGAQKELGEMRGQAKSVRDEIDAKKDDKAEFEAKGKAAADKIQPAIDGLTKAIVEALEKAANEVRERNKAGVNNEGAVAAAGRSRRGLSIA